MSCANKCATNADVISVSLINYRVYLGEQSLLFSPLAWADGSMDYSGP